MKIEKVMESIGKKMKNDYEGLSSQFNHKGLKGEDREDILKQFLKKYLTQRFGVSKGEIVSVDGQKSKQQDIVIYDLHGCPLLYNERNVQIIPIEGVYIVIEVKSLLNDKQIEESILNTSSVKKMPKEAYFEEKSNFKRVVTELGESKKYFNTMGILFAFSSNLSLKTLRKKIEEKYKKLKIPRKEQIDLVFILNKGAIVPFDKKTKSVNTTVELNTEPCIVEIKNDILLFYLIVMERLAVITTPPISVKKYAKFLYKVKY